MFKPMLFICTGLFICLSLSAWAQPIGSADRKVLVAKQDSLKVYADSMINAQQAGKRFTADSHFVKTFVRALKINNSFYFPFDSLTTISQLYPPDSSFRIFTWQLKKDEYVYLQKGAIQMRTRDGSLKLFPLFDVSMFTSRLTDSIRSTNNWIGAIYYNIVQKSYKGKQYYTLIGFDNFSVASNRKWMDVLSFNESGEPKFGGAFSIKADTSKIARIQHRFYIEYKKEASTTFNYNPELDMVIYDHLISETDQPERKESYIPDGDFEAFKWENGQWVYVSKVFDFKLEDGGFPQDAIIRDADGKIDERKLIEQSEKNKQKAKQKK